MKKIFFLSLLSVALYSCSNDDFDVTSNNTGSYMETIESKSNLVLENGLDNSLTDSLKLDDMDSVTSFKVEYIKKSSINQNYKSHNNISRAARYSYDGIVNGGIWIHKNFYKKGYTSLYTMIYPGNYASAKDVWINHIAKTMERSYNALLQYRNNQ